VVNPAAWVDDTYTLTFVTAGTYELRNSANTLVTSGAYTAGSTISFNGAQVSVSGEPAVGDTFVMAPAGSESLFDTLDQLVATLSAGAEDSASRSVLNSGINAAVGQIDQALTHVLNLRSEVGSRLSAVDSSEESREAVDFELQQSLSDLQDLDYAEAVSRMNQQLTSLQAAQAAYTRIAQMSLFDYL
jgi:flagellar hook-associated protein 3 FlgL